MKLSLPVRRELGYFLLCGIAGFAVFPAVITLVGTWMMHRGTFSPEVWPSSIAEGYLGFFSLLCQRIKRGHLLLPSVEIVVCLLLPYALFQLTRWTLRLVRSLRVARLFI
jgi:hypothetical protein